MQKKALSTKKPLQLKDINEWIRETPIIDIISHERFMSCTTLPDNKGNRYWRVQMLSEPNPGSDRKKTIWPDILVSSNVYTFDKLIEK